MPVQTTVSPARSASGHSSAPSQASLLSAVATLRDALAPGMALTVPAVLDQPSLLALLSILLPNATVTTTAAPGQVVTSPRLNLAGFCRVCLIPDCRDADCISQWSRIRWRICHVCHGSGYADIDNGPDNAVTLCDECSHTGVIETLSWAVAG